MRVLSAEGVVNITRLSHDMRPAYLPSSLWRCTAPYAYIVAFASLWTALLLRNVSNWDFPLSGEYLTSPFFGEILKRSLGVWDEHFGLGFSNLLGGTDMAQYAAAYGGAMWVAGNALNTLFQWLGPALYLNQAFGILMLSLAVYSTLSHFKYAHPSVIKKLLLGTAIVIIIHATDFFVNNVSSAGRFVLGQGLLLLAFIQYRRQSILGFSQTDKSWLLPLAITLATLLLVFNPYFLAFGLLIGIQGSVEFISARQGRIQVAFFYAKIFATCIALIVLIYGHVWVPPLFSAEATLVSGAVGRHDSPMQYPVADLLRFFNSSQATYFSVFGSWLQFGLVILGVIWAFTATSMKRWVAIDLLCLGIFIFLAKGSAEPYAAVNQWFHVNVPFLRLMGSGYPYFGVIYTLMIYYLIYGLIHSFDFCRAQWPRAGAYSVSALIIIALAIVVLRNSSYLSGDFGGRIQSIEYPSEYYSFKKTAEREMTQGRAYYFPDGGARVGMDYIYSPTHPSRPMDCCYDLPFSSVFPVGINWSNFNKYSGYYGQTMNFLIKNIQNGSELAIILSQADTRYAVFDFALKEASEASFSMMARRDQIRASGLFRLKPELSNARIEVYENSKWKPASTFATVTLANDDPNVFLDTIRRQPALGRPIIVSGAVSLQKVQDLKNKKLIHDALLYNTDDLGMMLELAYAPYEMKPDANTMTSMGALGWFTFNQVHQAQVTEKFGGRFIGKYPVATTAAQSRLRYYSDVSKSGNSNLFLRAMISPWGGRVVVHVNSRQIPIDLRSNGYAGLQWFDLGNVAVSFDKIKIEIEALDAGSFKRIDVMALIPRETAVASLASLQDVLKGIEIHRTENADYREWKALDQQSTFKLTMSQLLGDKAQISPKKLLIAHHNFMFSEDFSRVNEAAGENSYNLVAMHAESLAAPGQLKFQRNSGNGTAGFNASGGVQSGIYSLDYEIESCQQLSKLRIKLNTIFVTANRPLQVFVSPDGTSWTRTRTISSDENSWIDISDTARGKRKLFVRVSYDKPNADGVSLLISELQVQGVAGGDNMSCETAPARPSSLGVGPTLHANEGPVAPLGYVSLVDKAYDKNWRMAGNPAFNVNYGFAAFPIANREPQPELQNAWGWGYTLLLFASALSYVLLWIMMLLNILLRRFPCFVAKTGQPSHSV